MPTTMTATATFIGICRPARFSGSAAVMHVPCRRSYAALLHISDRPL